MIAVLTHRTGVLCLDKAFDLIEGCPNSSISRRLAALSMYIDFMHVTGDFTLKNPVKMRSLNKWRKNDESKPVEEWTLDLLLAGIKSEQDRVRFTFAVCDWSPRF
jgi:hypothetical protein